MPETKNFLDEFTPVVCRTTIADEQNTATTTYPNHDADDLILFIHACVLYAELLTIEFILVWIGNLYGINPKIVKTFGRVSVCSTFFVFPLKWYTKMINLTQRIHERLYPFKKL